jgi:death on curing protein
MSYLDVEEILYFHFQIISDFGGSHGVRDESRLQSVVAAPAQSVFGQDQYKTVYEKAAVYIRNIVADRPFSDGNKRTAITVGAVFLMRNGYSLIASPKMLEDFAVRVAVERLDIMAIATWVCEHTTKR